MNAIDVKDLTKRYKSKAGTTVALDAIAFHVEKGEIFGLIGADGAGKTTCFQILSGVMQPTSGDVKVMGLAPRDARARTGYLTQRFSLYQDLSVIENIRYSAGLRQVEEKDFEERRNRYLNAFDLKRFEDRLAGRLSGGMKQKLALSCALISGPDILLLDEPTTGVDPVSRRDFWDMLGILSAVGMTIVVATPYLDEAERCHRVAMIEQGKILDVDSPSNFRAKLGWTRFEVPADPKNLNSPHIKDVQRFGDHYDVLVDAPIPEFAGLTGHRPTLENAFVARLRQIRGAGNAPPFPGRVAKPRKLGESLLETAHLEKRFGSFRAVHDFTISIRRGEIYGLLGANGAGKTTAIKMMCGLLAPNKGTVSLLGHTERLRSAGIRSRIGYMSQKFTLYDDLTIGENLNFYANLYGIPRQFQAARKQWVLEVSDLKGQEKMLTAQLPGGWKQRVAFGAAIMHEPDLIFLDEPTSGVDSLARRSMWRMINELADNGSAILVVTHYLEEAEQCSKIGFMAAGEIILDGTPTQVRQSRPGYLLEVEASDTLRAIALLRLHYGTFEVSQFGNRLHIPNAKEEDVRAVLAAEKLEIIASERIGFTLEDVFLSLIQERKLAA